MSVCARRLHGRQDSPRDAPSNSLDPPVASCPAPGIDCDSRCSRRSRIDDDIGSRAVAGRFESPPPVFPRAGPPGAFPKGRFRPGPPGRPDGHRGVARGRRRADCRKFLRHRYHRQRLGGKAVRHGARATRDPSRVGAARAHHAVARRFDLHGHPGAERRRRRASRGAPSPRSCLRSGAGVVGAQTESPVGARDRK